jgi:hypothetical protein
MDEKKDYQTGNPFLLQIMVPKAGFEPARVAPPPPQDGVSAYSTTSASNIFFLSGFPRITRRKFLP